MSDRLFDPRQHEYDSALRSALRMAVSSVEPSADGLDQIRAKIAAKQSARRSLGWLTAAGLRGYRSWWRALLPPPGWFAAVVGAVIERFRPDPNRAGWFGWLRPAAAVMTGLFVVTAGSLAVAAIHSAITTTSGGPGHPTTSITTHRSRTSAKSTQPYSNTGGGTTPSGQGTTGSNGSSGTSTPSCSPTASGSGTPPASGSPSPSGSPSSTGSPSTSGSPTGSPSVGSPGPSDTSSGQSSPTNSPTVGGPGASQGPGSSSPGAPAPADSPYATGKVLLTPDALTATEFAGAREARGAHGARDVRGARQAAAGAAEPQPTASPTVGSTGPTTTPPPPPQC